MGDVTFGRSGLYDDAWKAKPLTYYTTSGVVIPGRSLMSLNVLFAVCVSEVVGTSTPQL